MTLKPLTLISLIAVTTRTISTYYIAMIGWTSPRNPCIKPRLLSPKGPASEGVIPEDSGERMSLFAAQVCTRLITIAFEVAKIMPLEADSSDSVSAGTSVEAGAGEIVPA
jgi:hypothetical protein